MIFILENFAEIDVFLGRVEEIVQLRTPIQKAPPKSFKATQGHGSRV